MDKAPKALGSSARTCALFNAAMLLPPSAAACSGEMEASCAVVRPATTAVDMAARLMASLPVVDSMLTEYAELIARGHGDEDISAVYRLKQELFDP